MKYTGVTDVNIIVEIHLEPCLVLRLENAHDLIGLNGSMLKKKREISFNFVNSRYNHMESTNSILPGLSPSGFSNLKLTKIA